MRVYGQQLLCGRRGSILVGWEDKGPLRQATAPWDLHSCWPGTVPRLPALEAFDATTFPEEIGNFSKADISVLHQCGSHQLVVGHSWETPGLGGAFPGPVVPCCGPGESGSWAGHRSPSCT